MQMIQQSANIISSGREIDVNDVTILDKEKNLFKRGVKEAVWVRIKNSSLNCNSGTRIKFSHYWDRFINTAHSFLPI